MSTSVYPYLPVEQRREAEAQSTANELSWLLNSLEETLLALRIGLEECATLLAPVQPGSTLVLSSPRSERIKGHVTRVGHTIVRGTLSLRLRTHAPLNLAVASTSSTESSSTTLPVIGFPLATLTALRTLLQKSLDCLDMTRFTGPRASAAARDLAAQFFASQLRLLQSFLQESLSILKGSSPPPPSSDSCRTSVYEAAAWYNEESECISFTPELPSAVVLNVNIHECSLLVTIRVLESCAQQPTLGSRFLTGIGAQRPLEHDELNKEFTYRGELVRVKEKYRVESSADPCLLSCASKLEALERTVLGAREALRVVMDLEQKELSN
ncbi:Bgt-2073 [Blumeria graminis f. sp. tritici]|uniref:Bgt-2073 n=2 Tax=Blumeria graminis f. sp. tritici TaxID=62690 RepID=A0A9X9L771_BLUGR|nr:hypothetical protein BGT96224_2073 [Blumeria graminis f. sp. tritici 96224]VCU39060.1 Bgt-2073 [Blumeria graminis f. sp. tritici]